MARAGPMWSTWDATARYRRSTTRTWTRLMRGNALHHFASQPLVMGAHCKIADGDNADEPLVAVQDGQTTDLLLFDQLSCLSDILVLEAIDDLFRHSLTNRGRLRI